MLVCSLWCSIIETLWKHLVRRDFDDFLSTEPLLPEDLSRASRFGEHSALHANPATQFPRDPFVELYNLDFLHRVDVLTSDIFMRVRLSETQLVKLDSPHEDSNHWKKKYIEFHAISKYNISGNDWLAVYGGHGLERVKVIQRGYRITTIKLRGDVNVPTGKPTFEVVLGRDGRHGVGRIHLASTGYVNPHWGFCSIEINESAEQGFYMHWYLGLEHVISKRFWRSSGDDELARLSHEV